MLHGQEVLTRLGIRCWDYIMLTLNYLSSSLYNPSKVRGRYSPKVTGFRVENQH